ncbi:ornithine carbamoyltransferase [Intestinicryptomonas porci]|uniref:Ornithine carbamoyltransferase n=1 Tax=Intestinicryptomonas porci TaxID=2926320 RepID=A0ABU4WGW6_9BACT|nr:ornithine carbamoyltransferase [Opitutales bacterium CLA-KB-P66]
MRSFLRETDFSFDEAKEVFNIASRYKKIRGAGRLDVLKDQSWGLIFFKKSTRTRLSFQTGVYELGANPMVLEADDLQISRGETIEDTAKVMGRYLHGIVIRAFGHDVVEDFKKYSGIPVVNALTDALHPCQSYTDIFTMMEHFGNGNPTLEAIKGRKFVFYGDTACNMAYSLALAGGMFGLEVVLSGPEEFRPTKELDKFFEDANLNPTWTFEPDPEKAAKNADVLYTDVWVSMGKEAEKAERIKTMSPYQVNEKLFAKAKDSAIFMHCLPAHAGEEVSAGVLNSKKAIIFDEAENRLHVQKAILTGLKF